MDYQVTVTVDGSPFTDLEADTALDTLTAFHAVLCTEHVRPAALISVTAGSIPEATAVAITVVEHATSRTALSVEAVDLEEWERRELLS